MVQQCFRMFSVGGLSLVAVVFLFTLLQAGEPSLKVAADSNGIVTVKLENDKPVRAVQFAVTGVKITEVRTTARTKGFLTKFNEQNGKVILLSTGGEKIAPGKGAVLEVVCNKPEAAVLSGVGIVEE